MAREVRAARDGLAAAGEAPHGENVSASQRSAVGLFVYVLLAFPSTWLVSACLNVFDVTIWPVTLDVRLLSAVALYALTMGWQPVVAVWIVRRFVEPPDRLDLGLRPSAEAYTLAGALAPMVLAFAASAIVWMVQGVDVAASNEPQLTPSLLRAALITVSFALTLLLVWGQALTEELGWRGFVLTRSMQRFGAWPGLALQGLLWGLWYAPVVLFAAHGHLPGTKTLEHIAAAVLTCALVGTLLGWLRLVSKSIQPAIVANSVLTLAAGAPYLLQGGDPGIRGAIFGPAGWVVLTLTLVLLAATRFRSAVRVPETEPEPELMLEIVPLQPRNQSTLH